MILNLSRLLIACCCCFALFSCGSSNPGATTANSQSQGIVYKQADPAANARAVQQIERILDPNYSGTDSLFGEAIACGPFFWKTLVDNNIMNDSVGIPMIVVVPVGGQQLQMAGRIIKPNSEIARFESYLRDILKNDGGFRIRKLNSRELEVYWAMIPYDIEEPIFILESSNHKIIVDFASDKILHVDDYQNAL